MNSGPATWTKQTLLNETAITLQECIRAEAGARVGYEPCIVDGKYTTDQIYASLGECVCVTCGDVHPWRGTGQMQAGHFFASRRASIVLVETNIHCQCANCNQPHGMAGCASEYRLFMHERYGREVIDQLYDLKNQVSTKWPRERLIEKREGYLHRTKLAIEKINRG